MPASVPRASAANRDSVTVSVTSYPQVIHRFRAHYPQAVDKQK